MVQENGETDAYSIAHREQALDFMADYPGYGEQRWYTTRSRPSRSRSAGAGCRRGPVAAAATGIGTQARRRSIS